MFVIYNLEKEKKHVPWAGRIRKSGRCVAPAVEPVNPTSIF